MKIQNVLHVFAQEKNIYSVCILASKQLKFSFISPKQKESLKPSSFTCKY